jgi:hypothetical protein
MKTQAVALYARVSSEQQAQAKTIDSQLAALRERIAHDGAVLRPDHAFVDAGYSGSTLIGVWQRFFHFGAIGSLPAKKMCTTKLNSPYKGPVQK